jgi:DNA polymerase-1
VPAPLLAVDAPSLLYRAFFALPDSIKDTDGEPVNALLGTANLILQAVEEHAPRAVVMCHGAESATYRTAALPAYHADRPPMPDALAHQWGQARGFFAAFGWEHLDAGDLEADDLLGTLAGLEREAGGTALLFTGDRDMFQCVDEHVAVLWPAGKGRAEVIDLAGVRARYGIEPGQVPDFIALRGDPSDGIPGAKGIGEKGAAQLLRDHGDLEALLALAADPAAVTPRAAAPQDRRDAAGAGR